MKYTYTKEVNKYVTSICSAPGNGGIHDSSQFVSAVGMLEDALATWRSPKLFHLILVNATTKDYAQFITQMKVKMKGTNVHYKVATELDAYKGFHQHWMVIVDTDRPDDFFDVYNDSSAISKVTKVIQRSVPDFHVEVAEPYKHDTPYIPVTASTLHDAADWFSYALKVRSKPAGRCYGSSRPLRRRHCRADRATPAGLAVMRGTDDLCRQYGGVERSAFHVAVHSGPRHAQLGRNLSLGHAISHHRF